MPVMIFDDSFSAVDTETDRKIRRNLMENRSGSTVMLISHRITTLMEADRIMVIEKGIALQILLHIMSLLIKKVCTGGFGPSRVSILIRHDEGVRLPLDEVMYEEQVETVQKLDHRLWFRLLPYLEPYRRNLLMAMACLAYLGT
jgi:energy-coupling factor transporter ATP-binding protein EcfA2